MTKIKAKTKWRTLRVGEILRKGDQWRSGGIKQGSGPWKATMYAGFWIEEAFKGDYRRRVIVKAKAAT